MRTLKISSKQTNAIKHVAILGLIKYAKNISPAQLELIGALELLVSYRVYYRVQFDGIDIRFNCGIELRSRNFRNLFIKQSLIAASERT
jgi:hypothetical protein